MDDFDTCDKTLSELLRIPVEQFKHARLPGRDAWRVCNVKKPYTAGWSADSTEEADALHKKCYQVYGWDEEFDMVFDGTDEDSDFDDDVDPGKPEEHPREGYQTDLNLDRPGRMVEQEDGSKVRVKEDAQTVFDSIESKFANFDKGRYIKGKPGKLILLMHDRAFRRHTEENPDLYTNMLRDLIMKLKAGGYRMDKISNY